ncbi:hypothetical protein [Amycolatopsis balhimycina]|uniref:hypothetical protein n=1 Tax=Amycolatopsis balhimycina TaxID=208443 RepID=UPI000361CB01|nr:hypothetical protein [Amycolatopsis balhimycina]
MSNLRWILGSYHPAGIADRLAGFLTNTPARSPIEAAFAVTDLRDGHQARIGSLRLTSRAVSHGMPAGSSPRSKR